MEIAVFNTNNTYKYCRKTKPAPSRNGKIGPKSAKFDPCDLKRSTFKIQLPTNFAPLWVLDMCHVWFGLSKNCSRSLI